MLIYAIFFYQKNCIDPFCSIAQMDGQWPNEPKIMNLLKSGLETERSMSQEDIDHNRLVIIGMTKTNNLNKKSYPRSSPRKICFYIFLTDLYTNYSSSLHYDFSPVFSPSLSFCNGVLPFYILFPFFILAIHVQIRLIILILVLSVPS